MNSYYRLYWKKQSGQYWSGGAYCDNLQSALTEYQRIYFSWKINETNDCDFKIVHTVITFENNTKTTKETEYNPTDVINDLAGGGS